MSTEKAIMQTIQELGKENGTEFTTKQLLKHYPVSRSVMSHYLNRLVESGYLTKTNTRPVKFRLSLNQKNSFQNFIGSSGSLSNQIEKCKSAVIYPPNGLPIILQGKSGVGKSYLASLIHKYALSKHVIGPDAPFIVLNCADYANNPELLSAVLFGYVRGAFTGAEDTKDGLIKEADGGFLFLDEIHRLSFENQEKLFLVLDSHRYRRLGDKSNWQNSNVRMIFATTEELDHSLLDTFRRRIPISVELPDFNARPFNERVQIITLFLHNESRIMKKNIQINPELIEQLALKNIEGNIGGLKNKIKVLCAVALKRSPQNSTSIRINSTDNNKYEEEAKKNSHDSLIININNEDVMFTSQLQMSDNHLLLLFIALDFHKMVNQFPIILNKIDIQQNKYRNTVFLPGLWQIVFNHLYPQIKKMGELYAFQINKHEIMIMVYLLALINQLSHIRLLNFQEIPLQIRKKYNKAFLLANKAKNNLSYIRNDINFDLETILAAFFQWKIGRTYQLSGIILTHGSSANGIAEVANHLCGGYLFEPFNMDINVGNKEIVQSVRNYVEKIETKNGLVLLVDMGSLEELYEPIKSDINGDLIIINNVSTAIAIDIGFKIKQDRTIEEIAESSKDAYKIDLRYYEGLAKGDNIIVSCLSGIGIASKIKEILESYILPDESEIITIDYKELKNLIKSGRKSAFKNTKLILTTTNISEQELPILNIEELVSGTRDVSHYFNMVSYEQFNEIRNKIVKLFSIEGASMRLNFLNPTIIINEVDRVIKEYEQYFNINFNSFLRMNLFLHIPLMIERVIVGHGYRDEEQANHQSSSVENFILLSRKIFNPILEKYNIEIPDEEFILIHDIIFEELNK